MAICRTLLKYIPRRPCNRGKWLAELRVRVRLLCHDHLLRIRTRNIGRREVSGGAAAGCVCCARVDRKPPPAVSSTYPSRCILCARVEGSLLCVIECALASLIVSAVRPRVVAALWGAGVVRHAAVPVESVAAELKAHALLKFVR